MKVLYCPGCGEHLTTDDNHGLQCRVCGKVINEYPMKRGVRLEISHLIAKCSDCQNTLEDPPYTLIVNDNPDGLREGVHYFDTEACIHSFTS